MVNWMPILQFNQSFRYKIMILRIRACLTVVFVFKQWFQFFRVPKLQTFICTDRLIAIGFWQVRIDRPHQPSWRTIAETSIACRAVSYQLHSSAADENTGLWLTCFKKEHDVLNFIWIFIKFCGWNNMFCFYTILFCINKV